jgi:hypothetical protein
MEKILQKQKEEAQGEGIGIGRWRIGQYHVKKKDITGG